MGWYKFESRLDCRYRGLPLKGPACGRDAQLHGCKGISSALLCMSEICRTVRALEEAVGARPAAHELSQTDRRHDPELSCRPYPVLVGREAGGAISICFCLSFAGRYSSFCLSFAGCSILIVLEEGNELFRSDPFLFCRLL